MQEIYLEVNIEKIRRNIKRIRSLDEKSMFCAVVKANAYGLGSVEISKNIEDIVDYFAVARAEEAFLLRKNNINKPILVLGFVSLGDIKMCSENNIDISIYDSNYCKKINDLGFKVNCHLAIDTGHSRLGFREFEINEIKKLKDFRHLNIKSAFSHFSSSDEEDTSFTGRQYKIFNRVIERLSDDFTFDFVHISNSAGAIKHKICKNMVRSGIAMYGLYPSDVLMEENEIYLEKSFNLYSTISFVKDIDINTPISYGSTFVSNRKMKVATVTIGYADGYMRKFSNCGVLIYKGVECRILGRVCMDQVIIDVTDLDVRIGDKVEVYKDIYWEAKKAETIPYELMTSISSRVKRIYFKNNKDGECIRYLGDSYES